MEQSHVNAASSLVVTAMSERDKDKVKIFTILFFGIRAFCAVSLPIVEAGARYACYLAQIRDVEQIVIMCDCFGDDLVADLR